MRCDVVELFERLVKRDLKPQGGAIEQRVREAVVLEVGHAFLGFGVAATFGRRLG